MPIHEVGYRPWEGRTVNSALRWSVIAGAGIRMVWRSHWLRRMLLVSWLPAAFFGMWFFVFEQAYKQPHMSRLLVWFLARIPQAHQALLQWTQHPAEARHAVWSLLLLSFFRYPQGTLMALVVGLIAPPLIARDFKSRAFLLYFSHPLTPAEYILGKSVVLWVYLAAITSLPALILYLLGVLLSPDLSVVRYTWDLPLRVLASSMVLIGPTTAIALCFSSMTNDTRYAGFSWFTLWVLGWVAYAYLQKIGADPQWSLISMYHTLGYVQDWVFGLAANANQVGPAAALLVIVTAGSYIVIVSRVYAPMRI